MEKEVFVSSVWKFNVSQDLVRISGDMGHKIDRSGDMGVISTHTYPSIWVYHEISRRHTPVISSYQLPPPPPIYSPPPAPAALYPRGLNKVNLNHYLKPKKKINQTN